MGSWYYVDEEVAAGPVDDTALRQLAERGVLRPGSLVTPVGATRWYTLAEHDVALGLTRNQLGEYGPTPLDGVQVPRPGTGPPGGFESAPGGAAGPTRPRRRPASWRRRTVGGLADLVGFGLLAGAVALVGGGVDVASGSERTTVQIGARALLLTGAVAVVYFGLVVGLTGYTPGKALVGARVVDEAGGDVVGPMRAVLRFLACLLLVALCVVPLVVDLAWPLWDRRRQTLHDKALGTVVVVRGRSSAPRAHGAPRTHGRRSAAERGGGGGSGVVQGEGRSDTQPNSVSGSPSS